MAKEEEVKKLAANEIREMVETFNTDFQSWHARQDIDYDWWHMKRRKKDKFTKEITYNDPRVQADAIMQVLEAAILNITINRLDDNKKLETKTMHLDYALLKEADDRLVSRQMPSYKSANIFFGCIRGAMAGRWPLKETDEKPWLDLLPYDPRYIAWRSSGDGLLWFANNTWRDTQTLAMEYNKDFGIFMTTDQKRRQSIQVIECFDRKYYYVVFSTGAPDNLTEEALFKEHGLDHIPVVINSVGSNPLVVGEGDRYDNIADFSESIYSGSRDLFKIKNEMLGIWADILEKCQRQGGFVITDSDNPIKDSPYGKDEWMPLSLGTTVVPLVPPDIAKTLPDFIELISQAIERDGFPRVSFGQLWMGQELSKRAIAELKAGSNKKLTPLVTALNRHYRSGLKLVNEQFADMEIKKTKVRGVDNKGRLFIDDVKSNDIDPECDVNVDFVAITPQDEADNYGKAEMSKQWAPPSFIRENIIKFQDIEGMDQAMQIEVMAPALSDKVKFMDAIKACMAKGDRDKAQVLMWDLEKMIIDEMAPYGYTPDVIKKALDGIVVDEEKPIQEGEEPLVPPETMSEDQIALALQTAMVQRGSGTAGGLPPQQTQTVPPQMPVPGGQQ
jgi:hypothetical protein